MRVRTPLFALLFVLFVTNAGAVLPTHSQTSPPMPASGTQRVIVKLNVKTTPEHLLPDRNAVIVQRQAISGAQAELQSALEDQSYVVTRKYQTLPFLAIEAKPEVIDKLTMISEVYPDQLFRMALPQSVPLIRADQAWLQGFDGTGSVVAVLDTGVDGVHAFLAGKVVNEACFSGNSNCPNGTATQVGQGAAVPCAYAPSACRHGTHVAGIAAGRGATFSGVARGAQIIAVQVFSKFTGRSFCGTEEDPCALAYTSDLVAAMEHVYEIRDQYRIAAVNLSLGGGLYSSASQCDADNANKPMKAIIGILRSVGIATIAAAGNDSESNGINAPACISSAISVGSTTKSDTISEFSNSASFLSLLAPGSSIQSSVPGGGFAVFSGTSMATPHVAGAWAVLKQKSPQACVGDVLSALVGSGVWLTDPRNGVRKRRIDVAEALTLQGTAQVGTRRPRVNFDGDCKSDIGIYRAGTWSILRSSDGGNTIVGWGGAAQDILVPADYDGDGKTDVAIYRDGTWSILRSSDGGNTVVGWGGAPQDIVVPGDYDGDGKADIAIYRAGAWSIVRSSDGGNTVVGWGGAPQDIVVPADYDGDGKTDIAIYRDGTWSILRSSDGGNTIVGWGGAGGDIPVPADYDGDGKADIAIYRNGAWSIVRSSDGGNSVVAAGGGPQDIPLPADYDGDGKADIAIYRNGTWIIQRSSDGGNTVVNWGGGAQDIPLK
jgi:subtilisin